MSARRGNRQSALLAGPAYHPPMVENYSQRLVFEEKANGILARRAFWQAMLNQSAGSGRPPMQASVRAASVANAQEVRGSQRWQSSRRSRQACYSFSGIDGRLLAAYRDSGRAARRAEKAAKRAGRLLVVECSTFIPARRERATRRVRATSSDERADMMARVRQSIGTVHPTS